MHANDNARSAGKPFTPCVLIIGSVTAERITFSRGFDLKAAASALRPKPRLRLVGKEL